MDKFIEGLIEESNNKLERHRKLLSYINIKYDWLVTIEEENGLFSLCGGCDEEIVDIMDMYRTPEEATKANRENLSKRDLL